MTTRADPDAHRPLTRQDARTLALASLGGALEFYDFIIFVFFTSVIAHLFFPPGMPDWLQQTQAFGIFAAGYLARPLGGIVMAHFGDLFGRKRMFTLSVFLMAVPTLLMGVIPTYATAGYAAPVMLLALRLLQGAAIGGEAPGAWVFVSEHVPDRHVGFACGLLAGGLIAGILLGSIMATAINLIYTPAEIASWAWRIPFVVGGIAGFIAMILRRWLQETPVFEAIRARAETSEMPLKEVLHRHGRGTVISMLITWMLTAAIVVVILMTPTLMQKLHGIPAADTLMASVAATLVLSLSAPLAGVAIDRFGPLPVMVLGGLGLIASTYALYIGTAANPALLLPLHALAGLFVGVISVTPYVIVRSFPAAIRFTGMSFSYNVAYAIFGGVTPMVVSALLAVDRMGPAHYVAGVTLVGIATVAADRLRRVARPRMVAGIPAR
ncbi:MFS transporter [Roseomonas sp. OT10]|uniref:MFS transporter n=1 Tax=Roseomonas cutis TaxID=2897332 RepID=UPI001E3C1BD9|nr:MFS transporter [Roseomonas sp. OT10]UFN47432.1 MFS transporter [Roseomonas sp. OT10]